MIENGKAWETGEKLLRDSFKMDMAKETEKTTDETKLAKLYPSNKNRCDRNPVMTRYIKS